MKFNFNEYSIDLGDVAVDDSKFKMENDTSYLQKFVKMYKTSKQYRESQLPLKLECIFNIKNIIGSYKTYFEPLAGLGITAKIFDVGDSELNDVAPDCVEVLKRNFDTERVTQISMFDYDYTNKDYDFIFLDFNNFTLKKFTTTYKPVVEQAFKNSNTYVLINDCSRFYLQYGEASYKNYSKLIGKELLSNNLLGYYMTFKDYMRALYPNWQLTWVESFKDTSFLLFVKTEVASLGFHHNIIDNLKVKTSISE